MGKFTADKEETKPDWFHFGSEDLLGFASSLRDTFGFNLCPHLHI